VESSMHLSSEEFAAPRLSSAALRGSAAGCTVLEFVRRPLLEGKCLF